MLTRMPRGFVSGRRARRIRAAACTRLRRGAMVRGAHRTRSRARASLTSKSADHRASSCRPSRAASRSAGRLPAGNVTVPDPGEGRCASRGMGWGGCLRRGQRAVTAGTRVKAWKRRAGPPSRGGRNCAGNATRVLDAIGTAAAVARSLPVSTSMRTRAAPPLAQGVARLTSTATGAILTSTAPGARRLNRSWRHPGSRRFGDGANCRHRESTSHAQLRSPCDGRLFGDAWLRGVRDRGSAGGSGGTHPAGPRCPGQGPGRGDGAQHRRGLRAVSRRSRGRRRAHARVPSAHVSS